ncbi:hypothetical protein TCAL_03292 [Tigriopus californicus]|uniref:GPS domain-containing protein n=1 Tax=Tigriopus californicus TaxID=6832 RepID=A0A553NPB4_TIGCA|nr:latrophilin-like protein LAT-2 [Tigriopus californicus]TRY67266.1 hypothetical protein TCAL_03292 [Tigriopus californicus]|eukprot:TCALIF_03292-PA protein Name:"Similar to LPHN3 Latrophilin-3 (Homo sapiens)" AED:0.12 eAED:0.13 QI:0/-1/0/1/-1/1/1/0/700
MVVSDQRVAMKIVFWLVCGRHFGLLNAFEGDCFCECTHETQIVVSFPSKLPSEPISCPDKVSMPNIKQAWYGLDSLATCQNYCKDKPKRHWINVTKELQGSCYSESGCHTKFESSQSLAETGQDPKYKFWYICFECPRDGSMEDKKKKCRKHIRQTRCDTDINFEFHPQRSDVTEAPIADFQEIKSSHEVRRFRELNKKDKIKIGLKLLEAKLTGSIPGRKVEGRVFKRPKEALEEFLIKSEQALGLLSGALQPNETIDIDFDAVGSFSILRRDNQQFGSNVFDSFKGVNLPDQPSLRTHENSLLAGVIKYKNSIVKEILNTGNIAALKSVAIFDSDGNVTNQNLHQAVTLHFKQVKLPPIEGQTVEPQCVFWNFKSSNWSNDGCQTIQNSDGVTTCSCNHLTNFAVILNIIDLDESTTEVLRLLTLIGCALSSVGLIGTIFFFRTLNSNEYNDRVRINEQFCANLLAVQILIFFGMDQTDHSLVCKAVALGLQYFLLVSFAWSLFAGHQIYVLLVEVFESEANRMKQYLVLGYGIPLALIIISLIVDHAALEDQTYGTDQACWMSPNSLFYVSFLTPIFLVTFINVVMLSLVIVKVFRIHPRPHFYSQARGWLSLALFLGVTWVLGLVAKVSSSYYLAVTFAVLNALQGFLIFCFHVVLGSKLRDIVKRKIKTHSDFSDDSRRNHTVQKSNESRTMSLS